MKKQVLVQIRGLHAAQGEAEGEPLELVAAGEHYFRNGSHYIRYEETQEGSAETIVNYLRLCPQSMELLKKGPVHTRMVFEPGKKHAASYHTPFGVFQMGIDAGKLVFTEEETALEMKVEYAMEVNGSHAADCRLTVRVEEKPDGQNFS